MDNLHQECCMMSVHVIGKKLLTHFGFEAGPAGFRFFVCLFVF
jgi:hypothetical protein